MDTPPTIEPNHHDWAYRVRKIRIPSSASFMGIWFAVALHVTWAALLIAGAAPKNVTGIHILSQIFPARTGLVIILLAVAAMAAHAITAGDLSISYRIMFLVPQQLILGISAAGATRAMVLSHFADGVARPHTFLIADQAPQIFALLMHSATIVYIALMRGWKR